MFSIKIDVPGYTFQSFQVLAQVSLPIPTSIPTGRAIGEVQTVPMVRDAFICRVPEDIAENDNLFKYVQALGSEKNLFIALPEMLLDINP